MSTVWLVMMAGNLQQIVKLDYDGALPSDLIDRIRWALQMLKRTTETVMIRRTRNGYHVKFVLSEPLEAVALVALQAILGSDPRRECFNLVRAQSLDQAPPEWRDMFNVLYLEKL